MLDPWRWRHKETTKRGKPVTRRHGVISQNSCILAATTNIFRCVVRARAAALRTLDAERRQSGTSLRHSRQESRTTGHATSEEKSNSEEGRRGKNLRKKKGNYITKNSLRYGKVGTTVWMSFAWVSVTVPAVPWGRQNIGTEVTAASFNGDVCSNRAPNYAALRILLYTQRNKTGRLQFPLVSTYT